MAAESRYLLAIVGFAPQKTRGSNRRPGLTVLIRAFGRMPMFPIVGTEIPSAKATFGVPLLSMSGLAIMHQMTPTWPANPLRGMPNQAASMGGFVSSAAAGRVK